MKRGKGGHFLSFLWIIFLRVYSSKGQEPNFLHLTQSIHGMLNSVMDGLIQNTSVRCMFHFIDSSSNQNHQEQFILPTLVYQHENFRYYGMAIIWMPVYISLCSRLGNWELCPHLVVDLDTLELTSAFLETYRAQLPKSGHYYFLLQPAPAQEAAKRAHTLFQHSFFDKEIEHLTSIQHLSDPASQSPYSNHTLGIECSPLPANIEGKHTCLLERPHSHNPWGTLWHLERKQVPVC